MTATWEKKEGNEGVLTVTVPAEKVNKALDQAFKKVVKQINVPGFRKGKVPRPIFEATVTVEPEVKLGDYKGLEIEKQETDLSDEELQESIDHSLSHLAEMVVKEDGAVENGDTVNIDFSGSVDGEEFDGGQAEGYDLEIGSGSFIPGFEEQIEGMKTGDEKDVVVTFPEEYHAEELAGKEATFKTKVNEIKFKDVPELNDEIANELDSDAENVDEYKENLRKRLSEQKATEAENTEKEEAINKATENASIDIPEAMINTELDRMIQEFGQRIQQQGLDLQTYYQISGQNEEQLRDQMKDDAEQRVKTNLTLTAIADEENIEVSDEDIDKELEKMSEQFNISVEDIKSTLGNTDIVKNDVRIQKVIDLLRDNAKYVEATKED